MLIKSHRQQIREPGAVEMNINTILLIILNVGIFTYLIFDVIAYFKILRDIECIKRGFWWDAKNKVWTDGQYKAYTDLKSVWIIRRNQIKRKWMKWRS